jgi:hypothetical protein
MHKIVIETSYVALNVEMILHFLFPCETEEGETKVVQKENFVGKEEVRLLF